MQTFLISRDLLHNMNVLDNKRLGKQRVECLQILNALSGKSRGWRSHPAVLMWHDREDFLKFYMDTCVIEWMDRGFKNTMPLNYAWSLGYGYCMAQDSIIKPSWWLDDRVFDSHKSNLLRKDPVHYGQFGWGVGPDLPYFWPVTKADIEAKRVLELCP